MHLKKKLDSFDLFFFLVVFGKGEIKLQMSSMFQMISMVRDTSGDNMEVTSTDIQHKDDSEAAVSKYVFFCNI